VLRLASSSPRRIQLLRLLQIPFESTAPNVDERRFDAPARAKADALARSGEVTLAADTEIELDGDRMGKPKDESHAVALLATLSGREHDVRTEVAFVAANGARRHFAVRSRVAMHELSLRQIDRYVSTGEPLDKAGGYAIQGEGRRLVESYARPEIVCQAHFDIVCPVWRAAQRQGRALHDGAEYRSWSEDVAGLE